MSTEPNAMDKALAQAQAAADAAPSTPTVIDQATPAAMPAKGGTLTLDDFQRETPQVDAWLKIALDGFTVRDGKVAEFTDAKINAVMNISDLKYAKRLSYGDPAVYFTSHDGVYAEDGQLWQVVLDNARRATGKSDIKDYMSCSVQVKLLEDTGGAKAGDNIGYQTSKTQNKNLDALIRTAQAAGIGPDEDFEVVIGCEVITSKKGFKWAVHTYEFGGAYVEEE